MSSLYFSINFQLAVEFVSRPLYEFLAHNPIYQIRYDTAKSAKEMFIVLERAAVVMKWATAESRRNCLTVLACGSPSEDMRCWCNL